jgi:eukaryotic-like serine/threonine-protein kinase
VNAEQKTAEAPKCSRCGAALPSDAPGGHCIACLLQLGLAADEPARPPAMPSLVELGDRIGRYKLLQEIGEGGAGVVYMAQQEEPVRRRVALKIIKLGMDTRQVVARFEAERQALALMDHPNIAKVFDAGATDSGRPYFVMELVCGVKITDYCDERKLSTRQRLDLFVQVCQAIQHAHQKGIIHRDLKPSNILVTEENGASRPKIIDFGIAKATTGQSLTDKTVFTAFEQFIGTPAYMSPEQAGLGKLDVDTRSDIYSLGVLLYELLTGEPPFDLGELRHEALDHILLTIREKEPPRPSARLTTMTQQELLAVAGRRQSEALKLPRLLRGDLDWIVMKALDKDRGRRYETANALAMDVQRHLKNEPVTARSPSPLYRLEKLIRRNKAAFAAMIVVAAALALGAGFSTWRYAKEKRAREEAETARANEARLRLRAQERADVQAKVAQARILMAKNKLGEAEMLLDTIPPSLIGADNDHAPLLRLLAFRHAFQNHWKESAASFAVLLQADRLNDLHLRDLDYEWRAVTLAELGDTNGYEHFRQEEAAEFIGVKNPTTASRVAKTILLLPAEQKWLAPMGALYDAMARFQNDPGALDAHPESWACNSLALVDYRRGRYAKAAEWSLRSLAYKRGDSGYAMARVLLALSHFQLHREEQARFEVAYARVPIDRFFQADAGKLKLSDGGTFFDWIAARILLREATALIGQGSSAGGTSPLEARAKLEQAAKLCAGAKYEETEQALREIPADALLLEAYEAGSAFDHVGWWRLQNRQWPQAEASWRVVAFGPDDAGSLYAGRRLSEFYLNYAPLLVEMGETNIYEKLRVTALSAFGETGDYLNALRTLTLCELRPPEAGLAANLDKLAEVVARGDPRQTNRPAAADACVALYSCRRGEYAEALSLLRKIEGALNGKPALAAKCHILAALACRHLGQRDQARSELARCARIVEKKFNAPPPASGEGGRSAWNDWWIDHCLLLEAKGLTDSAADPNPGGPG